MLNKIVIIEAFEFFHGNMRKLSEPNGFFAEKRDSTDLSSGVNLIREILPENEILSATPPHCAGFGVLGEISNPETSPNPEELSFRYYRHYLARCREIEDMRYFDESLEFDRLYDVLNENVLNCRN